MTTPQWQPRDEWEQVAADRQAKAVELQAALDGYLAGRPGWSNWEGTWSSTTYSEPGVIHTRRQLCVITYKGKIVGGKGQWSASTHDQAEFEDPAEAVAWAEQPRSEDPIQHRQAMAAMDAYARRNDIDLDGLKGVKVDSGLTGGEDRNHFDVIDFEGDHRVRITTLTTRGGYRVAYNRRHRFVSVDGMDGAERTRAVADVVREMTGTAGTREERTAS